MKPHEYNASLGQNVPDIVAENFGEQDNIWQFWDNNQPMEIGDFLHSGQKVIVNPPNNAVGNFFKKRGTRVATMNVSQADVIHPYFVLRNEGCCWHLVDCSGFPLGEVSTYVYEVWNEDETLLLLSMETDNPDYCFGEYYAFIFQNVVIKCTVSNSFGTFTANSISTYVDLPPIAYQFNVYGSPVNFQIMVNPASWIYVDWGDGTNDFRDEIKHFYTEPSDFSHEYTFADGDVHLVTVYGCRDAIFVDNKV
jgi:hypothetical protein